MDTDSIIAGLAEINAFCMVAFAQTGNEIMKRYVECTNEAIRIINGACCEKCKHAEPTDIDGLFVCIRDGHYKDCDLVCSRWEAKNDGRKDPD